MKKQNFIFLTALLCLLLCAACSKTAEPAVVPAAENTEPAEAGAPVSGGTITIGISQDLDQSLDPHVSTSAGKREILFNVFEGLVKPDENGEMQPALAESYEISEGGDSFTFHLRPGVKFHNGKVMTAEDVIYSLDRCRGAETGQPLVAALAAIKSIEKVDDATIVISLDEPYIELLAYLNTAIIPCDYDQQDTAPVGTGPFRFESRSVQENIVLKKFEEYWGEPAYLDEAVFKVIENTDALVIALRSGSIDLTIHRTPEEIKGLENQFNVLQGYNNMVQALYLNHEVEPLDQLEVRQAMNYAIDLKTIMDMVFDGLGTPAGSSMFPAFTKYFMPELAETYPFDPEKAKEMLAAAGYPNGFDLTITVPSNYLMHVNTAQVVAEQLKNVGINAKINLVEWATWLSDVYQGRNFEATVVSFDASALTARAMLERWISTSSKNMINFSDEEYDQVMADAQVCPDPEEQTELYKRAETILAEQAANVYLMDPAELTLMNKNLDGYTFYPLSVIDLAKIHFIN